MTEDDGERQAERIDRLEMRFAEVERALDELDAAVTDQSREIERLRLSVDRLLDRLVEAERRLPAEPDGPPPHH